MDERSLTVRDEALMPSTFTGLMQQAEMLVKSNLLPVEIKSAQTAATIMLMGRELGIPPMQAFRGIYVVKGKPTLSAQLMGALILRAGHSYRVESLTDKECAITFVRKGGRPYTHKFTMDDAKRADLASGPTWGKYPSAMLFSRCMSAGARICMPDVIAGMYTPEEIADPHSVSVDTETGEVHVIDMPKAEAPEQSRAETPSLVHWIDSVDEHGKPVKPKFWGWAKALLELTEDEVHKALEVEHIHEYKGTKAEAAKVLEAYATAKKALAKALADEQAEPEEGQQ